MRKKSAACYASLLTFSLLSACDTPMATTTTVTSKDLIGPKESSKPKEIQGTPYFLPKTMLKVSIVGAHAKADAPDPSKYTIAVKVLGTDQIADPNAIYLANINTEWGTNDEIKIETNTKGLLESVIAVSEDNTADILKKISDTAAKVITSIGTGGVAPAIAGAKATCEKDSLQNFTVEYMIDIQEFADKNAATEEALTKLVFNAMTPAASFANLKPGQKSERVTFKFQAKRLGTLPQTGLGSGTRPENVSGIRMRMPRPVSYELNVFPSTYYCVFGAQQTTVAGVDALMMDPNAEFVLDMDRAPLVKKTVNLTVKDGVLVSMEVKQPSVILAVASLPLDLINILLSPIANLIHGPEQTNASGVGK